MRINKDIVFSVDRGTNEELAQTLAVFERDGIDPFSNRDYMEIPKNIFIGCFIDDGSGYVYGTCERCDIHYTPSEFLARFGSVDDVREEHDRIQKIYFDAWMKEQQCKGSEISTNAPDAIIGDPASESLSCLREAIDIVGGARKAEYGDQRVNFKKYADIATLMLDSADLEALASGKITSSVVVKVLMAVKIGRHAFKPKRDNVVDLCGYADILHSVQGG